MIQKKICLLGGFAVGKTSLVRRYVESLFDERYLTTVGVKIDKKVVEIDGRQVNLMIWDLAGEDEFAKLNGSYLRGASGFILVADPTRPATVEKMFELLQKAQQSAPGARGVVALNKVDLLDEWRLEEAHQQQLQALDMPVLRTSAKTGEEVEALFVKLSSSMLLGGQGDA